MRIFQIQKKSIADFRCCKDLNFRMGNFKDLKKKIGLRLIFLNFVKKNISVTFINVTFHP